MIDKVPVTVLMPVYNCDKYVGEAIDSVLDQTFENFEFIIVNDGSTDNTEKVIRAYNDPRIKLINQTNGGVSHALNTGLKHAEGKYIARFDADDICFKSRLKEQYDFMVANPEYVLIGADAEYVSKDGEPVFSFQSGAYTDEEIRENILDRNPFIHSVVMFPKEVVVQCGGYDERAHTFEDHLLWISVLRKGKACNFKKPLIRVRLNPASVTTDNRLRGKVFNQLRHDILQAGKPVTKEQGDHLLSIIRQQSNYKMKLVGYHHFVAKKLLWNNYQPRQARQHLLASLRLRPFDAFGLILLFVSFLPENMVVKLYRRMK